MKRTLLFFIFMIFSFLTFAEDESSMYWEKEIDMNGQLITYYLFKTDEQLLNNIELIIKTITGINNEYFMPNINSIRKQMVSEKYIEKNYPQVYKRFIEQNNDDNSEELESSAIDWDDYKYCFFGFSLGNDVGVLILFKRIDEKVYFSLSIYMFGGLDWNYTNKTLDLFENTLSVD